MDTVKQRQNAKSFVNYWKDRGFHEDEETQKFWIELIEHVLGVPKASRVIDFEKKVKIDGTTKRIDGYITKTKILIEQKKRTVDLSSKLLQSDGVKLSPFEQAKRYATDIGKDFYPNYIVVSNFTEFQIHDMADTSAEPTIIKLEDLPDQLYRLSFLVDVDKELTEFEKQVSIEAGEIVGEMYDALLKQYENQSSRESLISLNKLCVRLVFCLYAEDSGLFANHSQFHDYLKKYSKVDPRIALIELFKVLNTPENERHYLSSELAAFPYVNGGLFADDIEIPLITPGIVEIILKRASEGFDWKYISPTIFGAVFESTLNPETRRQGGMHYTSVENIHKVIDPLFLDDLKKELKSILELKVPQTRNKKLEDFRKKLGKLTFLDPACGSGNFLTETYLSLRRLENEALRASYGGQLAFGEGFNPVYVHISQFYGIEINDFAVTVAQTALWIAESQMIKETEDIVDRSLDFLPLKSAAHIEEGNALRKEWPVFDLNYIISNPPFLGARLMTKEQKKDIELIFGENWQNKGNLDYVTAWFKKVSDLIKGTTIKAALVATNSICQGEQVPILWQPLFKGGLLIDFAYRTFRWDSESTNKAHVYCIIVGFSYLPTVQFKIFASQDTNKTEIKTPFQIVRNINAYLLDAPNVFLQSRNRPLWPNVPAPRIGNKPIDGGFYLFSPEDYRSFIEKEPLAKKWFRKWLGAEEFVNNKERYCLFLRDISPSQLSMMPLSLDRVKKVEAYRKKSKNPGTVELAKEPRKFHVETVLKEEYILIPSATSSRRNYIPMGFISPDILPSNLVTVLANANKYHFGILTSSVHMAWMRTVAGRLGNGYRYSKDIVYNNFPWPNPTEKQKEAIEKTAKQILDIRKNYPESSLAQLYDPLTMPVDLLKAHKENDRAVMRAYGFKTSMKEPEIVAKLFELYKERVDELERQEKEEKEKKELEKKQKQATRTKKTPIAKSSKK